MAYPFVQAFHDYGVAKGPRLGITWHMAEGGGTVGFLSRKNRNGVSVHFVVEYSGRVVQMLRLDHANGSIRPTAIRASDDAAYTYAGVPIRYGATAAKAVLGAWHRDPNSATIGVEIEGFAKDGPNAAQKDALEALWRDLSSRLPGIRSLGHRDFADYKDCPGHKLPWDRLGGHGPEEVSPMAIYAAKPQAGTFTVPAGATVKGYRPVANGWEVAKTFGPVAEASSARYDQRLGRLSGTTTPSSLIHVANGALEGLYVAISAVDEVPDPEPVGPTQAEVEAARAAGIIVGTQAGRTAAFQAVADHLRALMGG